MAIPVLPFLNAFPIQPNLMMDSADNQGMAKKKDVPYGRRPFSNRNNKVLANGDFLCYDFIPTLYLCNIKTTAEATQVDVLIVRNQRLVYCIGVNSLANSIVDVDIDIFTFKSDDGTSEVAIGRIWVYFNPTLFWVNVENVGKNLIIFPHTTHVSRIGLICKTT